MMKLNRLIVISMLLLLTGTVAKASSEMETLIDMLHTNGTISDAQYARLQAELEEHKVKTTNKSLA